MILAMLTAAVTLTCGAATRPGVAQLGSDGIWRGRAVEACRAVAAADAGPETSITFHAYDDPAALRAAVEDDIAFLTPAELATLPLATTMRAGPTVSVGR